MKLGVRRVIPVLATWLLRPGVLRPVFALLRRVAPVLVVGRRAVVSRHAGVIEVLTRDTDFTIAEVNAERIERLNGAFILGMDRSPQYEREEALLREVVQREDLARIRGFVAKEANALIEAVRPRRRIDVVGDLARVVPTRLVATYFGVPGPDEPTLMRWMRDVFHDAFVNIFDDQEVRRDALRSANELTQYMNAEIDRRKSAPGAAGRLDDVLSRLIARQTSAYPWLDDDTVRRNVAGLIVGAVDTTSKVVTLAIDELLRRPKALRSARDAAMAGDVESVGRHASEAVRFNPHGAFVVRHCGREVELTAAARRPRRIPPGTSVYVATFSAMFDSEVFPEPAKFRTDRTAEYLHFGYGLHRCFGRFINGVQVPELLAALLRLPNLQRAPGRAGRIVYDGPFPDRLILTFDPAS